MVTGPDCYQNLLNHLMIKEVIFSSLFSIFYFIIFDYVNIHTFTNFRSMCILKTLSWKPLVSGSGLRLLAWLTSGLRAGGKMSPPFDPYRITLLKYRVIIHHFYLKRIMFSFF